MSEGDEQTIKAGIGGIQKNNCRYCLEGHVFDQSVYCSTDGKFHQHTDALLYKNYTPKNPNEEICEEYEALAEAILGKYSDSDIWSGERSVMGGASYLAKLCAPLYHAIHNLNMRKNMYPEIFDNDLIKETQYQAFRKLKAVSVGCVISNDKIRETYTIPGANGWMFEAMLKGHLRSQSGFKIDCHTHTSAQSPCAYHSPEKMCDRARKIGLNGIIITEHNVLTPQSKIDELNEKFAPLQVFSGIEINIKSNEKDDKGDDFIVLGIHDELLSNKSWRYIDLYNFTKEKGGYILLAHPLRYSSTVKADIYNYPPDAFELYSQNIDKYNPEAKQDALRLANIIGTKYSASSDAHAVRDFCYCNILDRTPESEKDIIQMLKDGEYCLGRLDNYGDKEE